MQGSCLCLDTAVVLLKTPGWHCITQDDGNVAVRKDLHWLSTWARLTYKVLLYAYKVVNGLAPPLTSRISLCYVPETFGFVSYATHRSWLYRSDQNCLGRQAFSISGPPLWNELPFGVRAVSFIESFKDELKLACLDRVISADCVPCFKELVELLSCIMIGILSVPLIDCKRHDQPVWIERRMNC